MENIVVIQSPLHDFGIETFFQKAMKQFSFENTKVIYIKGKSQKVGNQVKVLEEQGFEVEVLEFEALIAGYDKSPRIFTESLLFLLSEQELEIRNNYYKQLDNAKNVYVFGGVDVKMVKFTDTPINCFLFEQEKYKRSNHKELRHLSLPDVCDLFLVEKFICENDRAKNYMKDVLYHLKDEQLEVLD